VAHAVVRILQLTSSGIIHPPPQGAALYFLENVVGREMSTDRDISSVMIEFPGTRQSYIGGATGWGWNRTHTAASGPTGTSRGSATPIPKPYSRLISKCRKHRWEKSGDLPEEEI